MGCQMWLKQCFGKVKLTLIEPYNYMIYARLVPTHRVTMDTPCLASMFPTFEAPVSKLASIGDDF